MIKAVLFDLDGTLLDTLPDLTNIVNLTMRELGYPERTLEEVRTFVGYGLVKLIERALPVGEPMTEDILAVAKENYLKFQNMYAVPYEGVPKLLSDLRALNIKTGIVSNKINEAVQVILREYFPDTMDVGIGTMQGVRIKPYPDQCLLAFEKLGAAPSECIYVGDGETDLETAANAHMEALGASWGYRGEEFLLAHGAKHIVHAPSEVLSYVLAHREDAPEG